jgi:hypothetical protein
MWNALNELLKLLAATLKVLLNDQKAYMRYLSKEAQEREATKMLAHGRLQSFMVLLLLLVLLIFMGIWIIKH